MNRFSSILVGIGMGIPSILFLIDYLRSTYDFSFYFIGFSIFISPACALLGIIAGIGEVIKKKNDWKSFIGLLLNLLTLPFIWIIYKYAVENM